MDSIGDTATIAMTFIPQTSAASAMVVIIDIMSITAGMAAAESAAAGRSTMVS